MAGVLLWATSPDPETARALEDLASVRWYQDFVELCKLGKWTVPFLKWKSWNLMLMAEKNVATRKAIVAAIGVFRPKDRNRGVVLYFLSTGQQYDGCEWEERNVYTLLWEIRDEVVSYGVEGIRDTKTGK